MQHDLFAPETETTSNTPVGIEKGTDDYDIIRGQLENTPYDYTEPEFWRVGDHAWVVYITLDDDCYFTIEDQYSDTFWEEYRTEWERDEAAQNLADEHGANRVWIVDHMEHSVSVYTPAFQWSRKPDNYRPSDRWDTRPSIVLAFTGDKKWDPDSDYDPVALERAKGVCETMTSISQGDVYGVHCEHFVNDPENGWTPGDLEDNENLWGIVGSDYAEQEVEAFVKYIPIRASRL